MPRGLTPRSAAVAAASKWAPSPDDSDDDDEEEQPSSCSSSEADNASEYLEEEQKEWDLEEGEEEEDDEEDDDDDDEPLRSQSPPKSADHLAAERNVCTVLGMEYPREWKSLVSRLGLLDGLLSLPSVSDTVSATWKRVLAADPTAPRLDVDASPNVIDKAVSLASRVDIPADLVADAFAPLSEYDMGRVATSGQHVPSLFAVAVFVHMADLIAAAPEAVGEPSFQSSLSRSVVSVVLISDETTSLRVDCSNVEEDVSRLVSELNALSPLDRLRSLYANIVALLPSPPPPAAPRANPSLKKADVEVGRCFYDSRPTRAMHASAVQNGVIRVVLRLLLPDATNREQWKVMALDNVMRESVDEDGEVVDEDSVDTALDSILSSRLLQLAHGDVPFDAASFAEETVVLRHGDVATLRPDIFLSHRVTHRASEIIDDPDRISPQGIVETLRGMLYEGGDREPSHPLLRTMLTTCWTRFAASEESSAWPRRALLPRGWMMRASFAGRSESVGKTTTHSRTLPVKLGGGPCPSWLRFDAEMQDEEVADLLFGLRGHYPGLVQVDIVPHIPLFFVDPPSDLDTEIYLMRLHKLDYVDGVSRLFVSKLKELTRAKTEQKKALMAELPRLPKKDIDARVADSYASGRFHATTCRSAGSLRMEFVAGSFPAWDHRSGATKEEKRDAKRVREDVLTMTNAFRSAKQKLEVAKSVEPGGSAYEEAKERFEKEA